MLRCLEQWLGSAGDGRKYYPDKRVILFALPRESPSLALVDLGNARIGELKQFRFAAFRWNKRLIQSIVVLAEELQ